VAAHLECPSESPIAPNRRRKPIVLEPGQDPASVPLKHPPRELFGQAVARGVNVDVAYHEVGYAGGAASRRELRCSADVDARVRWLLVQRIESDAKTRARLVEKEQDARLRLIHELEAIAYVDPGDLMQWDRAPMFDDDGSGRRQKEIARSLSPLCRRQDRPRSRLPRDRRLGEA
jgi:hypothetical protein